MRWRQTVSKNCVTETSISGVLLFHVYVAYRYNYLQIPGIKARVITEMVQATTPLKTTISDVIGENADDMRTIMESGSEIIRDAFDVLVRLVTDVLALKGRVIASFGANGIDASANLFDGGKLMPNTPCKAVMFSTTGSYFIFP